MVGTHSIMMPTCTQLRRNWTRCATSYKWADTSASSVETGTLLLSVSQGKWAKHFVLFLFDNVIKAQLNPSIILLSWIGDWHTELLCIFLPIFPQANCLVVTLSFPWSTKRIYSRNNRWGLGMLKARNPVSLLWIIHEYDTVKHTMYSLSIIF